MTFWLSDSYPLVCFGMVGTVLTPIHSNYDLQNIRLWMDSEFECAVTLARFFKVPNRQVTILKKSSTEVNTDYLNSRNIWIPTLLKIGFQMAWYLNGWLMCFVLCTRSTIWYPDQYIRKHNVVHLSGIQIGIWIHYIRNQDGIHLSGIPKVGLSTIWHLTWLPTI